MKQKPRPTPKPGMGATLCHVNDMYPMTIVEVSKSGKTIVARHDQFWILNDTEGNRYEAYLPRMNAELITFRMRKNKHYVEKGSKFFPYLLVGKREYYRCPEI